MNSEHISVEPEIIQLGKQDTQTIKITNNTSNHLHNFFFCLYNTEKFQFNPDNFSLEPNQQKLIKITLKLKSTKVVTKQFAYLKSSETNKRITILINSVLSPQPKAISQQGLEELYTLSSRDYRQTQTVAFNKIINQKESYIKRLQNQIKERQNTYRHSSYRDKQQQGSNLYRQQLLMAESKIQMLQRQKETLLKENLLIHQRFTQYKSICEGQMRSSQAVTQHLQAKQIQVEKLYEEIRRLQEEGSQFLGRLTEKQTLSKQLQMKIYDLQRLNQSITEQLKIDNQRRIKILQEKLQQQRISYQNSFRLYEDKIKELQVLAESQSGRQEISSLQSQIRKLNIKIDEERRLRRQTEIKVRTEQQLQQSQKIKFQLLNNSLQQKNKSLNQKVLELQNINNKQTENRRFQQNNEQNRGKIDHYLQIALESCKNQNQMLKKNHTDLQRAYNRHQESSSQRIADFQKDINHLNQQLESQKNNYTKLSREKQLVQQQNHHSIMKLKIENVQLLEKIGKIQGGSRYEQIKDQLLQTVRQLEQYKCKDKENEERFQQIKKQNKNLLNKVNKYKKQAKSQLKNINHTAMEQLKRVHCQKKQLAKKIALMENSLDQNQKTKFKQLSKNHENFTEHNTKYPSRKIGIKDQRKQLEDSRANSVNNQNIYQQLGELRQFDTYVKNQQQRLGRIFNFSTNYNEFHGRSIFRAIKFFKQLENKLKEARDQAEQSTDAIKQLQFMRGRLTELQSIRKQKNQQDSCFKQKSSLYNAQLMEFIRAEMKNQYQKLHQTIKFNEEKHNLLKKKIYQQYRSRIIAQLQKKQKNSISQVQVTLQRFIEGLNNLSHKQALLNKQTKLKQNARKEVHSLRQKLKELTILLENKKGYCSRQPIRIWVPENQLDWQENLKLEAQLLSHDAQLHRLRSELQHAKDNSHQAKQQLKKCLEDLQDKEKQILKMKRNVVQIQQSAQKQLDKIIKENEELRLKINFIPHKTEHKGENNNERLRQKQKQYQQLKRDLENKRQLIKSLKQRQKMLETMLDQSSRNEQRSKRKTTEQMRINDSLRQIKQSNRELRRDNMQLKETINKLQQQLSRKTMYINSLKGDSEQHRIKTAKKDEQQVERLKDQIRILKEENRKCKDQIDKIKKKKDKEIGQLQDEIQKISNELKINEKVYESMVRALLETFKKIYSVIEIVLKRKGRRIPQGPNFDKLINSSNEINALKVYEYFEEPLNLLQSQ